MFKIVIVSKASFGVRPVAMGLDRGANIFKGSRSSHIKKNLEKKLEENNFEYSVEIDNYAKSLKAIKDQGADLIVLSPYIKDIISLDEISKDDYYILSEDEFLFGNIEKVMDIIKSNNNCYTSKQL